MLIERVLVICVALIIAEIVMAQNENSPISTVEIVDGATDPDEIPDRIKYGMFVKRYSIDVRDQLVQRLSADDDSILFTLSAEDEIAEAVEGQQYVEGMTELCARMHTLDAKQVAAEEWRILQRFRDNKLRRFTQRLNTLSESGRKIVDDYVAQYIVPNTRMQRDVDMRMVAANTPEEYLARFELNCQIMQTGSLPDSLQRKLDSRVHQVEQAMKEQAMSEAESRHGSDDND